MLTEIDFEQITIVWVMQYLLIFCRLGSAMMLFPGIGESYVQAQTRFIIAALLSLIVLPIMSPLLPSAIPFNPWSILLIYGSEIITGLFLGSMIRIMFSMIHVAGMIIAFQSSFASAMLFDPSQGSQGSVIGVFMTTIAVTLIFASDLHHIMFYGIADSYNLFKAGTIPLTGDMSEAITRMVSNGFNIGFKIAAPITVVIIILYFSAGIMSRLMPSMQVFFVIIPVQIIITFALLMLTISAAMMWYLDYYREALSFLDTSK